MLAKCIKGIPEVSDIDQLSGTLNSGKRLLAQNLEILTSLKQVLLTDDRHALSGNAFDQCYNPYLK